VHNWLEHFNKIGEFLGLIGKPIEDFHESFQVSVVLIRLCSGNLDFFLELTERSSIGRLVLLKELKNFLDSL
jgi:hypothetical protein